jgi:transposase-like protein
MKAEFLPPFCPNPTCVNHRHDRNPESSHPFYRRFGSFNSTRMGRIPRFCCSACHKTFSASTFRLDYYAKRSLDLCQIFRSISAGESLAAIARHLSCSSASIQNRLERLGRASLALHSRLSATLFYSENLVADGIESFDRSQYFPCHLTLLVGAESQFLFGITHATLRRKGRMTESQLRRRSFLETRFRPPSRALVDAFALLASTIPHHWNHFSFPSLFLKTDKHPAYLRALSSIPILAQQSASGSFCHVRYSSTLPRTLANPLFPVNYFDRELRKDLASFRRESPCFTRNVGAGLLRSACYLAWHNYLKPHRVKGERKASRGPCHGEVAGIPREKIDHGLMSLWSDRPFVSRDPIPVWALAIWERKYPTPLALHPDYVPGYARILPQQSSMN